MADLSHPRLWAIAQEMPQGWWFTIRDGSAPLAPHTVSLIMARAMRRADVPGTAHGLRHRWGTGVLKSSGGNLRVAQELLRHASPTTTAMYCKVEDSEKRSAVLALV